MKTSLPMYEVVKKYLVELIKTHKDDTSFRLPSENELAIKFKVSRITTKKALNDLEEEKLISRIKGKGSFIRKSDTDLQQNDYEMGVSIVLPQLDSEFIIDIVKGVQKFFRERSISVTIFSAEQLQKNEEACLRSCRNIGTSGILLCPIDSEFHNVEVLKLIVDQFPLVLLDRKLKYLDIFNITSNHYQASYDITTLLLQAGHKHIGFLNNQYEPLSSISERRAGYRNALEKHNLYNYEYYPKYKSLSLTDIYQGMLDFFHDNPQTTAVITSSGRYAHSLKKVLDVLGLRPHEDIEIICYDKMHEPYSNPFDNLAVYVEQNPNLIGYTGAQCLYDLIIKNETTERKNKSIFIPYTLINKELITSVKRR